MLNFKPITYGEIRNILKETYHAEKGFRRALFSDAPFIQQIEDVIKEGEGAQDSDELSPLKMLECAKLASRYNDQWMRDNRVKNKPYPYKKTASIKCCIAILEVFNKTLMDWLEKDDYRAFYEDIKNNDMIDDSMSEIQWIQLMRKSVCWWSYGDFLMPPLRRQFSPTSRAVIRTIGEANPKMARFLFNHLSNSFDLRGSCLEIIPALFIRNDADIFSEMMGIIKGRGDVYIPSSISDAVFSIRSALVHVLDRNLLKRDESFNLDMLVFLKREFGPENFLAGSEFGKLIGWAFDANQIELIHWIAENESLKFHNFMNSEGAYDLLCDCMGRAHNLDRLINLVPIFDSQCLVRAAVGKNNVALLEAILAKLIQEKIILASYLDSPQERGVLLQLAAKKRSHDVLTWIINYKPGYEEGEMITSHAIHEAFSQAESDKVWFLNRFPTLQSELMRYRDYHAFRAAVFSSDIVALNFFKQRFPDELDLMVKADDYFVIRGSNIIESQEGLNWLFANASPAILQTMLGRNRTDTRNLFKKAASFGNLVLLQMIVSNYSGSNRSSLICADNYESFRLAVVGKHKHVAFWLLNDPRCLAEVDGQSSYMMSYGDYVVEYLNLKIDALRSNVDASHEVGLNLTEDEIRNALVMIKALIRRNQRGNDGDIHFLLSIPAVRARAHQDIFEGVFAEDMENQLLRFARRVGNGEASALLLEVDEVRRLAEAANFYPQDNENADQGVDLRQLAENRESAMVKFTEAEKRCLERAMRHYQPFIKASGVEHLLNQMREDIASDYEAKPAMFTSAQGELVTLPLQYEDFERLGLSDADKDAALKAYYAHVAHTALRYLSKPNRWMHPRAGFVNRDPHDRTVGWSTFDRFEPLLAMVYLAAIDTEIPCVNDFTPETKFQHLMRELALINRAHNWDQFQTRDDNEADRPSCGPGTERRVFQSVPGNPLIVLLTKDTLTQEVVSFAFNYFKSKISADNVEELFKALDDYLIEFEVGGLSALEPLNITSEAQAAFLNELVEKYGDDYTKTGVFVDLVQGMLRLNPNSEDVNKHYHAITLSGATYLYDYLEKEVKNKKTEGGLSVHGLFSNKESEVKADKSNDSGALKNKPASQ